MPDLDSTERELGWNGFNVFKIILFISQLRNCILDYGLKRIHKINPIVKGAYRQKKPSDFYFI